VRVIRTPILAPNANAYSERFVGTLRRECLNWLPICSRRQLERTLRVYVDHYNHHRPHRSLELRAPDPLPRSIDPSPTRPAYVRRRDRLGGLLHEYQLAA
jgi:transposase InsO family protein